MKYIVTVDHPYYPSCEYFDDLALAEEYMKSEVEDSDIDGKNKFIVTLAEIKTEFIGKSHY